jgi:hypothetical protein
MTRPLIVGLALVALTHSSVIPKPVSLREIPGSCDTPDTHPDALDVDTAWRIRVATLEIVDRTGRFDITELLAELRRHFNLEKYIAHVQAHRLNISRDLFDFLMEYNRTVGEPLDINVAWAFFRTAHPDTTDSCHSMKIWYKLWLYTSHLEISDGERLSQAIVFDANGVTRGDMMLGNRGVELLLETAHRISAKEKGILH